MHYTPINLPRECCFLHEKAYEGVEKLSICLNNDLHCNETLHWSSDAILDSVIALKEMHVHMIRGRGVYTKRAGSVFRKWKAIEFPLILPIDQ